MADGTDIVLAAAVSTSLSWLLQKGLTDDTVGYRSVLGERLDAA